MEYNDKFIIITKLADAVKLVKELTLQIIMNRLDNVEQLTPHLGNIIDAFTEIGTQYNLPMGKYYLTLFDRFGDRIQINQAIQHGNAFINIFNCVNCNQFEVEIHLTE